MKIWKTLAKSLKAYASPWTLVAATAILAVVVAVMAAVNISREEEFISRVLSEKGAVLIRALEAGTRTGMRGMFRAGIKLQHLIEESAALEDIRFIAVTSANGKILAHNDPELIGANFLSPEQLERLKPEHDEKWSIVQSDLGASFMVFKTFRPLPGRPPRLPEGMMHQDRMPHGPPEFFSSQGRGPRQPSQDMSGIDLLIFVGMDMAPMERAKAADIRNSVVLSVVLFTLGLGGIMAIFWSQSIKSYKERLKLQTEKLEAVESLAAGVAHEVRNPLSSIKGYATYFGSKFSPDSEDSRSAGIMASEVERLNRVISELVDLARPYEIKPRPTDLNELVDRSLRLVAPDAEHNKVEIVFKPHPNLPKAHVDPDRITQTLLNMHLNAIQAMPEGGTLTVGTTPGHKRLAVEIADTGPGMEKKELGKIFDPYYTTKADGSGLGLSIVRKVVEAHDGNVNAISAPGDGTRFIIKLPKEG